MGKTLKLDSDHIQKHNPDEQELIEKDWKHHKAHKINNELSNKQIRGHFNEQHRWPLHDEHHQGRKKI